MVNYEIAEISVILGKVKTCFYAFLKFEELGKPFRGMSKEEITSYLAKSTEAKKIAHSFYHDHFLLILSEVYTFFYNHDDDEILNQLELTDAQRLILKKLRHSLAHVPDMEELLSRSSNFYSNADAHSLERDLIKMILHLRKMVPPMYDQKVVRDFKEIFELIPSGMVNEKIISGITGPL